MIEIHEKCMRNTGEIHGRNIKEIHTGEIQENCNKKLLIGHLASSPTPFLQPPDHLVELEKGKY